MYNCVDKNIFILFQINDALFPIGAYSHSYGLETYIQKNLIKNSNDVYNLFKGKFDDKEQEYFYCLYLDNRKKLKKKKLLFIGTINYSVVHPREIFKEAYMIGAVSIIIIHNHPTGDVNPSHQDIETTKKIIEVGKLLGIKIDDHVIVGQNNYYSFFENGLFD